MQAENLPLAVLTDAGCKTDRSRPDSALAAHLDVHGVEDEERILLVERSLVPAQRGGKVKNTFLRY